MKRLLFLLILSVGFYAYYHNRDAEIFKDIDFDKGINTVRERSWAMANEAPRVVNDWSRSFDKALDEFDWSALPSGDELLNGFEQSLNQFKKSLRSNDKNILNSLSNGMDNLILKAETIDLSTLSSSQKMRLNSLLQKAEDLSLEAKQKVRRMA